MASDYIYYYTKDTFEQRLLGEIQSNFNMSKVIDGTKDSMKVQVLNFSGEEIEPLTILEHRSTNTWWVVSHDKVERDMSESGFRYTHNLQLLGAIELLNARDLTDCGFNQNTYTIEEILYRLCRMSNFEFANNQDLNIEILSDELDINQNVDYMKTFENYTLLSALREVVSGYNCDIKLSFELTQDNKLYNALLTIIPKTGFSDKTPIEESEFSDVRETKTMDKNSFGTSVVSNAENVVSTKFKTFPLIGSTRLSGTEYEITPESGIFRLPSNIFKVISMKVFSPIKIYKKQVSINGTTITGGWEVNPYDNSSLQSLISKLRQSFITSYSSGTTDIPNLSDFDEHIDSIISSIKNSIPTINNSEKYNPATEQIVDLSTNSECRFIKNNIGAFGNIILTSKDLRDNIDNTTKTTTFYWERGKNYIHFPHGGTGSSNAFTFRLGSSSNEIDLYTFVVHGTGSVVDRTCTFCVGYPADYNSGQGGISLGYSSALARITYIPMSDLKVKYDNNSERNDTQLYNQNGKLNDSVAISKLLLSYSKEIESETITKYSCYYDFDKVPKCGELVSIGNDIYVINNVSLDFAQNETSNGNDYFISGEFTMSKNISTKSLLTNPNTNIRDYGIPQNNNVVRKQLYRDFYELGHEIDTNSDNNYYLSLNKILNISRTMLEYQEHIAVMKLGYEEQVDGKSNWYYQLDTTTYLMKKSLYEIVDFKDNNIIGYSSQNTTSEYDIQRVFDTSFDTKNTPISFVDSNGKVESIEIAFCTNGQLTNIYEQYKNNKGYGDNAKSIYNYSVFIPEEIYEGDFTYQQTESFGTLFITREPTTNHSLKINLKDEGLVPQDFDNYQTLSVSIIRCSEVVESETLDANFDYTITFTQPYTRNVELGIEVFNTETLTSIGAKHSNDFKIEEPTYYKDTLEVPFFEYSCQIDNSDDVIVGDNVFDQPITSKYWYQYALIPKGTINENNFNKIILPNITVKTLIPLVHTMNNAVKLEYYNNDKLLISLYESCTENDFTNQIDLSTIDKNNYDLLIVRRSFVLLLGGVKNDLMFVVKNLKNANINDNKIELRINHYKLK